MNRKGVPEDRRESFYHERIRQCGPCYEEFELTSAEAALNLLYTYDVFNQATAHYFAEFGLSKSTLNILLVLRHGAPEGMLLHDLGEMLLVSRANITGLVDHLESKGLVQRIVNAVDKRGRYARLTHRANELLDRFVPVHYRKVKAMLSGLTDDEKRTLTGLLQKARRSISDYDCAERVAAASE